VTPVYITDHQEYRHLFDFYILRLLLELSDVSLCPIVSVMFLVMQSTHRFHNVKKKKFLKNLACKAALLRRSLIWHC